MQSSFSAVEAALFFVLTSDGANDKYPPPRPSPRPFSSPAQSACVERALGAGQATPRSGAPAWSCERRTRQG